MHYHNRITEKEVESLKEGDIILRAGYGAVSNAIIKLLNDTCQVSHCGIIVRNDNEVGVIHTLSASVSPHNGVQYNTLEEFISESNENSITIVRLKNSDNSKIGIKARYYLQKKVPFDHFFNLTDSTAFFCSELPYRILRDAYALELVAEGESLPFSRFLAPEHFATIVANR